MQKDEVNLYTLGSRGSLPVCGEEYREFGGATTCFLLKKDKYALIVDCGTGLYKAKELLADCQKIDIVLTHMHYDHVLGLLKPDVFPKNIQLNFYSTFKNWYENNSFNDFLTKPYWPTHFMCNHILHDVGDTNNEVLLNGEFKAKFVPSNHPDNSNVIILECANHKIAFMFDFEHRSFSRFNYEELKNCDIILYDGMYDNEDYYMHSGWGHSTYEEGCSLAKMVNADYLIITHHSPECNDEKLLSKERKAKCLFSNTHFARCGDILKLK